MAITIRRGVNPALNEIAVQSIKKDWQFNCDRCDYRKRGYFKHLFTFSLRMDACLRDDKVHADYGHLPDLVTLRHSAISSECSDCDQEAFQRLQLAKLDKKCRSSNSPFRPKK